MPKRIYKIGKKIYKFSENDILNGQVGRTILYFSLPLVAGNFAFIIYNFIDLFWLGKLGKESLSAIAYALPILSVFQALGGGIIGAAGILVSQYKGANKEEALSYVVSQTIVFSAILGVIVALLGTLIARPVLYLLGASSDIVELAMSYLSIAIPGIIVIYNFFISRVFFRSVGNSIIPMFINILTFLIAAIVEPFLIFGWTFFPELGLKGSAVSILIARGIVSSMGLFILFRGFRGIRLKGSNFKPDFSFLKRILRLGLPVSFEIAIRSIGINTVLPIVSLFGTSTTAGFSIGSRFLKLSSNPIMGISQAVGVMTGQSLGAEKYGRVKETMKKAVGSAFVVFSLIGFSAFWASEYLVQFFSSDLEVIRIASQCIRITILSLGFIAATRIFIGIFRSAGNTLSSLFVSLATFILIQMPMAYFLAKIFGKTGIWWAIFLANIVGAFLSLILFKKGKGQQKIT